MRAITLAFPLLCRMPLRAAASAAASVTAMLGRMVMGWFMAYSFWLIVCWRPVLISGLKLGITGRLSFLCPLAHQPAHSPTSVSGFAVSQTFKPAGETAICKTTHRCKHRRSARRRSVPLRIGSSLRAGIFPSAGLGVDDDTCLCRCFAAYDYGAGISVQPRNIFNPPPVCRWVQPVWQGWCLLYFVTTNIESKNTRNIVAVQQLSLY